MTASIAPMMCVTAVEIAEISPVCAPPRVAAHTMSERGVAWAVTVIRMYVADMIHEMGASRMCAAHRSPCAKSARLAAESSSMMARSEAAASMFRPSSSCTCAQACVMWSSNRFLLLCRHSSPEFRGEPGHLLDAVVRASEPRVLRVVEAYGVHQIEQHLEIGPRSVRD